MFKQPEFLNKGDKVVILATSGKIKPDYVIGAQSYLAELGYDVQVKKSALANENYFAGDQKMRLDDIQSAFDDSECKAVLCARGGYGAVQLIDKVDLTQFLKYPKWLIGFSDITVFHCLLNSNGVQSIHGGMTKEFAEKTNNANELIDCFSGKIDALNWNYKYGIKGSSEGILLGGNLSILVSLLSTPFIPSFENAILFLEDIGESAYKIQRLFYTLKLSGLLSKTKGVIIGQLSGVDDAIEVFGKTIEDVILDLLIEYEIPVAFGLESGHEKVNHPLVFGKEVCLQVDKKSAELKYI